MTTTQAPIRPASAQERSKNPLRPDRLDDIIGQEKAKKLLRAAIEACFRLRQPLDHCLLIGPSGTGKTTFSHAVANELGTQVFELEAPVSYDTLYELRTTMLDGDLLKIEEIHQQGIMERRGRSGATQPEVLYAVMEDRTLQTPTGPLDFPRITIVGTTTDEGRLPDAFINRFPLQPRLVPYTIEEMVEIARMNAGSLRVDLHPDAARVFATACRAVPRQMNNFMRNAAMLSPTVTGTVALEVLDLNEVTRDGLTADMQNMLTFLYTKSSRRTGDGEIVYQASVNTIATAIGKSRDSKAISLRVEPWLIERGLVQVTHGGRRLTDKGVDRAERLLEGIGV